MPTLETFSQEHLYTMFKGEPGTRKATAALSYPTPQYWINTDQKMSWALTPMKNWGISPSLIHYDYFPDYNSIRTKLEHLQVNCPYKTVVIKTITSIGDTINAQTKKLKSGETTRGGAEKGNRVGGIAVNTMEDYKAEAAAFQELTSLTKDIHHFHKCNIILIAHVIGERKPEEKAQSTHFSRIIVTGGKIISAKIPAYCDEVYHFNVEQNVDASKEGDYAIITRHTGDDFARTTLPLPRKVLFNDKPLYDMFIKPAILKLKETSIAVKL